MTDFCKKRLARFDAVIVDAVELRNRGRLESALPQAGSPRVEGSRSVDEGVVEVEECKLSDPDPADCHPAQDRGCLTARVSANGLRKTRPARKAGRANPWVTSPQPVESQHESYSVGPAGSTCRSLCGCAEGGGLEPHPRVIPHSWLSTSCGTPVHFTLRRQRCLVQGRPTSVQKRQQEGGAPGPVEEEDTLAQRRLAARVCGNDA